MVACQAHTAAKRFLTQPIATFWRTVRPRTPCPASLHIPLLAPQAILTPPTPSAPGHNCTQFALRAAASLVVLHDYLVLLPETMAALQERENALSTLSMLQVRRHARGIGR